MKSLSKLTVVTFSALVLSSALAQSSPIAPVTSDDPGATTDIEPRSGSAVKGKVRFVPVAGGTKVMINLEGLAPGDHGFHVHQIGDCSAEDGSSAGPHFNPKNMAHGGPNDTFRHIGDLGNVTADSDGKVNSEFVDRHLTLEGPNSIIGRSVIVHEKSDDLKTDPTGNAGGRIGCGVINPVKIEIAGPEKR